MKLRSARIRYTGQRPSDKLPGRQRSDRFDFLDVQSQMFRRTSPRSQIPNIRSKHQDLINLQVILMLEYITVTPMICLFVIRVFFALNTLFSLWLRRFWMNLLPVVKAYCRMLKFLWKCCVYQKWDSKFRCDKWCSYSYFFSIVFMLIHVKALDLLTTSYPDCLVPYSTHMPLDKDQVQCLPILHCNPLCD